MPTDPVAATLARPGKFLCCVLGGEEYGLELARVQEIIGSRELARVPRSPACLRGLVELRGRVVPVVDLRACFGLPAVEDFVRACIVVVQVGRGDLGVTLGVIVDEVAEVLSFARDQIEPAPVSGGMVGADAIIGVGKLGSKAVILLDADRMLAGEELEAVVQAAR